MGAGEVTGHLKDPNPATVSSLVMSESWRIKQADDVSFKTAYWRACEQVGTLFDPARTAQDINSLMAAYRARARAEAAKDAMAEPTQSLRVDGALGHGWYNIVEPPMTKVEELTKYLDGLRLGEARMKRDLTKEEAALWQQSMAAWARRPENKKAWYDRDGKPRYTTAVVLLPQGDYALVIKRNWE